MGGTMRWAELRMCRFWAGGISSFPFSRAREYRLLRRLSLFRHAKSTQSVDDDIKTRDLTSRHACLELKFAFKKKIGSLSEGIGFQLYSFQWINHTFDDIRTIFNEV